MPQLPAGLPSNVASLYTAARTTKQQLIAQDVLVTKLTSDLASAQTTESALTQTDRDNRKAAAAGFTAFVADLQTQAESFIDAPDDAPDQSAIDAAKAEADKAAADKAAADAAAALVTDPNAAGAT